MGRLEELRTKKQYTIYRMWHSSTPWVRYVGITTQPLLHRLLEHLRHIGNFNRGNAGHNKQKEEWLISLIEKGLAPHIDTLETFYGTFAQARVIEDKWIISYLNCPAFTLLNAKLPKQTQTLVERKETPFVPEPFTYEQNKEILTITNVSRSLRDCDCDRESYDASFPYRSFCISGGESLYNSEPTGANKEQV